MSEIDIEDYPSKEVRNELLEYSNVHSVGIGLEEKDGEKTGNVCVTVRVTNKKDISELDEDDILPDNIENTVVDVIEEEKLSFRGNPGNNDNLQRDVRNEVVRPLVGGLTSNSANNGTAIGSGAFVDSDGDLISITNAHVVCEDDEDPCIGNDVYQPDTFSVDEEIVGEVKNIGQIDPNAENVDDNVDAAYVKINDNIDIIPGYFGLDRQTSPSEPRLSARVVNSGSRSGYTSGQIIEVDATVVVAFDFGDVTFTGVTRSDSITSPGDSGSITGYLNSDGSFTPVLCHFAGTEDSSTGVPISRIEEELGELSNPSLEDDMPTISSTDELLEVTVRSISGGDGEIIINYVVSNTGGVTSTQDISLFDDTSSLIDSNEHTLNPQEFTIDSFTISDSFENSDLSIETNDHIDEFSIGTVGGEFFVTSYNLTGNSTIEKSWNLNIEERGNTIGSNANAMFKNRYYIVDQDNSDNVAAYDKKSGDKIWSISSDDFRMDASRFGVITSSSNSGIKYISLNGNLIESNDTITNSTPQSLNWAGNKIVLATSSDLYVLDKDLVVVDSKSDFEDINGTEGFSDVYFVADGNQIISYSTNDFTQLNTYTASGDVLDIYTFKDKLFAITENGNVLILSKALNLEENNDIFSSSSGYELCVSEDFIVADFLIYDRQHGSINPLGPGNLPRDLEIDEDLLIYSANAIFDAELRIIDLTKEPINNPENPSSSPETSLLEDSNVDFEVSVKNDSTSRDIQSIEFIWNKNIQNSKQVNIPSLSSETVTFSRSITEEDLGYNTFAFETDFNRIGFGIYVFEGGQIEVIDFNAPNNVEKDEVIDFNATIRNEGDAPFSDTIGYEFNTDIKITDDTSLLDEGEEEEFEYTYKVDYEEGDYVHGIYTNTNSIENNIQVTPIQQLNELESIISQDWDDIAIDDGTVSSSFGNYKAKIYPRNGGQVLQSPIDSISYTGEVNAVKGLTIDVEPYKELHGIDYLGGVVDVFINNEPLFSGEIFKIDTSQNGGEFYKIKAEPPGKKLRDENIDESTDNFILSDYIGKTIDKFNRWDDEHFEIEGTESEELFNVIQSERNRLAGTGGGTVIYNNVGENANDVEVIRFKADIDGEFTINVETNNSSFQETFTSSEGTYGEWFSIYPKKMAVESYNLVFEMSEGDVLYDWISLNEENLSRDIVPEIAQILDEQTSIQRAEFQEDFESILEDQIQDTDPYKIEDGKLIPLQTSFTFEGEESFITTLKGSESYSDGEATGLGGTFTEQGQSGTWNGETEYKIEDPVFYWRRELEPDDEEDEEIVLPGFQIKVNDEVYETFAEGFSYSPIDGSFAQLDWRANPPFEPSPIEGSFTIEIEINDVDDDFEGYGELIVDCLSLVDGRYDYNFDNEVHEPEGYLDGPEPYPKENDIPKLELPEISVGEVIEKAILEVITDDPNGIGELGISFNSGETFQTLEDSDRLEVENNLLTASVIGRVGTKGWESGEPLNETPRLGYDRQEIDLYELFVTTNTIEILFDKNVSGNRLKAITDIIDSSRLFYRWEGKKCKIFQRGSIETDVDLRKENISSSVSIEDVYSSCEVIGRDGIRSGVIESDEAPDFVDRHKEIRNPDITSESDVRREALSFLDNNSTIDFTAQISTLPTLAPLGEELSGENFNHGESSFIEKVRYGKRRSNIDCGRSKDLSTEILDLDRGVDSSQRRDTE